MTRSQGTARLAPGPVCPWCDKPAAATRTGQCIYCLKPLPEFASSIEPAEILRLSEFQSTLQARRRSAPRGWVRKLISISIGVLVGFAIVGLFAACLRWLTGLLMRGVSQA